MSDRKNPPPQDPDELEPWERRELGLTDFEMSETLYQQASLEEHQDPDVAERKLLRALVHAQHAIYQELRALGDRQQEERERYEKAAEVMERHASDLKTHAGAVSNHSDALHSHARQMDALTKAIAGHGDDVRDALRRGLH